MAIKIRLTNEYKAAYEILQNIISPEQSYFYIVPNSFWSNDAEFETDRKIPTCLK